MAGVFGAVKNNFLMFKQCLHAIQSFLSAWTSTAGNIGMLTKAWVKIRWSTLAFAFPRSGGERRWHQQARRLVILVRHLPPGRKVHKAMNNVGACLLVYSIRKWRRRTWDALKRGPLGELADELQ